MVPLLYKWVAVGSLSLLHPFFVSVTDIQLNPKDKELEVSCKIFTDDFEKTLEATYHTKVDLLHPADKKATDQLVNDYISRHLLVKVDGKPVKLQFIGHEKEEEATWSYFEVPGVSSLKQIEIHNDLLYESKKEQVNIIYVTVDKERKGTRLNNPDASVRFEF